MKYNKFQILHNLFLYNEILSFVDFVTNESKNDPDFFRWFFDDENLPDCAENSLSANQLKEFNDFLDFYSEIKK